MTPEEEADKQHLIRFIGYLLGEYQKIRVENIEMRIAMQKAAVKE